VRRATTVLDNPDTTGSSATFKYIDTWKKLRAKLKGAVYINLLARELRLYGTSSMVTDQSKSYKQNLKSLIEVLRLKGSDDTGADEALPRGMFGPQHKFKRLWNMLLIILLVYTATIMPYRMAFIDSESVDSSWFVLEAVIDGLFFSDILINFNSAVELADGSLVTSRRQIVVKYLRSWFFLDLLACLPFSVMEEAFGWDKQDNSASDYNSMIRLIRLPRLYRLIRIARICKLVRHSRESEVMEKFQDLLQLNRGVMRIVSFALTILVIVHIVGCLWFFLAKLEGFTPDSWVVRHRLVDSPMSSQYIAAIYWSFTTLATVGYGDIVGKTDLERAFSILWMIFGVGFYSFTIGSLTSILTSLDTTNNELTMKLNAVDQMSREARLERSLMSKLRRAIKMHSKKTQLDTGDKQLMFDSLPKKLRYQVAVTMYENAASRLPFFKSRSPEFISTIIPYLRFSMIEIDELIYKEKDDSDEIYFLFKGRVNFVISLQALPFKTMLEGSYFGDVEVFLKEKRLCTAKAEVDCELLIMHKPVRHNQMVKYIFEDFPEIAQEMLDLAVERRLRMMQSKDNVVSTLKKTRLHQFIEESLTSK
jgi:CRP-like cAMP-binding protein